MYRKCMIALLAVAVAAVAWRAVASGAACAVAPDGPFAVRISAPTDEILVIEGLPIIIEWSVVGDEATGLTNTHGTIRSGGSAHVRMPSGRLIRVRNFDSHPTPFTASPKIRERQPGETWEERVFLTCAWPDPEKPIFGEVGEYEVWVQYNNGTITAESNHLFVEVREPREEAEKKALALVRQLKPPAFLYTGRWVLDDSGVEMLTKITEVEGSVVYPSYARVALAAAHVSRAGYGRQMRREDINVKQELDAAQAHFEKVDPGVATLKPALDQLREEIKFERQRYEESDPNHRRLKEIEEQIQRILEFKERESEEIET